jgi:hypothetical protein
MAQYDQAARYLIRQAPLAFFRWMIPRFLEGREYQRFVDASPVAFPGEPDRVCDTVAEFLPMDSIGPRWLVDTEVQAEPHSDMLERLGEYAYRLRRDLRYGKGKKGKYKVLSVLLNLTGAAQRDELDMTVSELMGAGTRLRVVLRTLRNESATATLARIERQELERPILPWIPLMQGAGEAGIIEDWKRLAGQEPDNRWRSDYGALAGIFAELAGRKQIWKTSLEGWTVKQSTVVQEWIDEATKELVEKAKQDTLKAKQEAREQGLQEGRQEGRLEEKRQTLFDALQTRFGAPLPVRLTSAISRQTDLHELGRWFKLALITNSLKEFRSAIGR